MGSEHTLTVTRRAMRNERVSVQPTRTHPSLIPVCFATVVSLVKRGRSGGSAGNEQLTAVVATILIVLLLIEGATLLRVRSLLTVHAFVGMLLIPLVALKIGSTGWRMLRYYLGREQYVQRGPPHVALRVLVGPLLVLSTILVFGTGVALLFLDQTHGTVVGLHKASFVVWSGAFGIHVLAHVLKLPRLVWARIPGAGLRVALVAGVLVAGAALAVATLPGAEKLQDRATSQFGFDGG